MKGGFEMGMPASSLFNWINCLPAGIALLDLQQTSFEINEWIDGST